MTPETIQFLKDWGALIMALIAAVTFFSNIFAGQRAKGKHEARIDTIEKDVNNLGDDLRDHKACNDKDNAIIMDALARIETDIKWLVSQK